MRRRKRSGIAVFCLLLMLGLAGCASPAEGTNVENGHEHIPLGQQTTTPSAAADGTDVKGNDAEPGTGENTGEGTGDNTGGMTGDTPENDGDSIQTSNPQAEPLVLVLDAGHGGVFPGAVYDGREEKGLTLQLALYLGEILELEYTGVRVVYTRDTDTQLSESVAEDLRLRAEFAQEQGAAAFISLHFNASEQHNQNGAMVFVSKQAAVSEVSDGLAEAILEELSLLGLTNEGVRRRDSNDMYDEQGEPLDYYAVNRHCAARGIPGIIVEHCFIDGANDIAYLDSDEDLYRLACADAAGIAAYYGLERVQ